MQQFNKLATQLRFLAVELLLLELVITNSNSASNSASNISISNYYYITESFVFLKQHFIKDK